MDFMINNMPLLVILQSINLARCGAKGWMEQRLHINAFGAGRGHFNAAAQLETANSGKEKKYVLFCSVIVGEKQN